MAQPNYEPDIQPDIRPNLHLVGSNEQSATASQLAAAESRPSLQVINGGGESTPERANLHAVDDISGAEKAGNPATAIPFQNKTTQKASSSAIKGAGGKALMFFKKRSAVIGIGAVIAGAATFPFLGALSLPFSLFGNLTLQSVMQGASQYLEDYMGFKIFGSDLINKTSVSFKDDKMAGLTGAQIDELEKNGVKLNNPTKTITGKTTFESIEVGGNTIKNATEFKSVMQSHPELRSKVIISKPSLWKSAKSAVAKGILAKENVNTDPKMNEGTPEEEKQQILKDAVEDTTSEVNSVNNSGDKPTDAQKADAQDAESIVSDFNDEITAAKQAVSEGVQTPLNTEMDNIPKLFSTEAPVSKNLLKTVWNNTLNPLGLTTDMCTAYQIADTANTLARVFVAANLIRLALTFRASVEKVMAGDGDTSTLTEYMNILNTKNPSTGESFDQSAAAQMVFNNMVSGDPMTLTALGGAGMAILYAGMRGINSIFGAGHPSLGRAAIKSTCNIANNLGVQVTALVGSVALGIFTGGASAAVEVGGTEAARIGVQASIKAIVKKTVEDIVEQVAEKGALTTIKDLAKGAMKNAAKKSWTAIKDILTSPKDLLSLALVGTQTFAMGYIVDALTGGNIANALYSGTSFISGVITGSNLFDYRNAVASGGVVTSVPQATAYLNNEYRSYQQSYIAYMQDQARSTPFDVTNQYSAIGSAVASFQKTFGAGAFSSIASSITSLASLPGNLSKLFMNSAYADSTPDLAAVNAAVANPFYSENNIAVQITGTPLAVFNKSNSFANIKAQLIDSASPQISYDGDNPTTDEPILSVIPGSKLDEYRNKCHNADNTELDDMFQDDPASKSNFDLSCTATGRSNGVQIDDSTTINASEASLYDDAIAYIAQVSPSASDTTASGDTNGDTSTPTGTCPTGTNIVNGITTGWERTTGGGTDITLCSIPNTTMQVNPGWKDSRYKGTSSLGIKEIVVNSSAAQALLDLSKEYTKEKKGDKLSASVGYRSVYEQCSFFFGNGNSPSASQKVYYNKYCAPNASWLKYPTGSWNPRGTVISNHMMGYSIDFTGASETWLYQCQNGATDGKNDGRCYGFYNDVSGDTPHFTYKPK